MATGQVPDRLVLLLAQPLRHELQEMLAVRAKDPHRTVLRVDELTGRTHDPGEDLGQLEVRGNRHHGVQERRQTLLRLACCLRATAQLVEHLVRVERDSRRPEGCRSFCVAVGLHAADSRACPLSAGPSQ